MLDAALAWVKTNTAQIVVCSSQPTTYAQATSSYLLGKKSHTISASPGDYASGRQLAVSAASSISITSGGPMAHIALVKDASSLLVYVTVIPASSQASVAASDKVNTSAWNIQLADAAAPA